MVSIKKLREIGLLDPKDFNRLKSKFGSEHPEEFGGEKKASKGVEYLRKKFNEFRRESVKLRSVKTKEKVREGDTGMFIHADENLHLPKISFNPSDYTVHDVEDFMNGFSQFKKTIYKLLGLFVSLAVNAKGKGNTYTFDLRKHNQNTSKIKGILGLHDEIVAPDYLWHKVRNNHVRVIGKVGDNFGHGMMDCKAELGMQNKDSVGTNKVIDEEVAGSWLGDKMIHSDMTVYGSVGFHCGSQIGENSRITVFGNARNDPGELAKESCRILVYGSVKDGIGNLLDGAVIHVLKSCNRQLGRWMQTGLIVVGSPDHPAEKIGEDIGYDMRTGKMENLPDKKAVIIMFYNSPDELQDRIAKGEDAPARDDYTFIYCVKNNGGRNYDIIQLWPGRQIVRSELSREGLMSELNKLTEPYTIQEEDFK